MNNINFQELITCRHILDDRIVRNLEYDELSNNSLALLVEQAEKLGFSGNLIKSHIINLLIRKPNLVSETIEKQGGIIGDSLKSIFVNDMKILLPILSGEAEYLNSDFVKDYKPTKIKSATSFNELEKLLSEASTPESIAEIFINYYRRYGYGDIADYRAFRWNDKLTGIRNFENIHLDDLIGYQHQKDLLTANTEAFVSNKPANNVLLVGARGTGKSSSVKALVNEYYDRSLRLLQITKPQLLNLPDIMEALRQFASKRFIIFLDDLSFEESDPEYKYLKSAIEGGVESRPENVLIYATSNRRHLIRETWRDRVDGQDELYRDDSVNETISLSDRFGLIIHYYAPTQAEYLAIIRHMLNKQGIEMSDENLRIEGLRWEMTHSGRNGRTAQQFVTNYLGQH